MKRTFQCAFVAATVLMSGSAFAQTFSEKGQLAISAERLFGFSYSSATASTDNVDFDSSSTSFSLLTASPAVNMSNGGVWFGYGSPRVAGDYFIIDHLSLGAALGYAHVSVTTKAPIGNTESTSSGSMFTFAPRVGYFIGFTDLIGFWPRGGFTYRNVSIEDNSNHNLALTLEAPFLFTPLKNVGFWAGPTLDLGFTGSQSFKNAAGQTVSSDFNSLEIGIQTGLLAYFDL